MSISLSNPSLGNRAEHSFRLSFKKLITFILLLNNSPEKLIQQQFNWQFNYNEP